MITLPTDIVHKIEWCENLLQRLDATISEFLSSSPVIAEPFVPNWNDSSEASPNRTYWQIRIKKRFETPSELPLLAGDFIQNLRSCLDYLAHALVISTGGTPKVGGFGTSFPILEERKPKPPKITGCDSELVNVLIETLQPYNSPSPEEHPLFRINALANEFKHRELRMPVGLAGYPANFAILDKTVSPVEGAAMPNLRFISDGDYLDPLMFPFRTGIKPEVMAEFKCIVSLDPSKRPLYSVTAELDYYLRYVRDDLIPSFRDFFDVSWPEDVFNRGEVEQPQPDIGELSLPQIQQSFHDFYQKVSGGDPDAHVMVMSLVEGLNTETS